MFVQLLLFHRREAQKKSAKHNLATTPISVCYFCYILPRNYIYLFRKCMQSCLGSDVCLTIGINFSKVPESYSLPQPECVGKRHLLPLCSACYEHSTFL